MHRCSSSSHGNMVGPCTCGVIHHTQSNSSFSMLFSMPNNHKPYDHYHESQHDHHHHHMYPFTSPTSSSVDCTLSLGTPSTRLTDNDVVLDDKRNERRSGSYVSNFCWDLLQPKHHATSTPSSHHKNGSRGGNINGVSHSVSNNNDPLLARRCANCDTTSTPLWRNGPRGPKSLCNACGIRFKKEERRATAAAANGASSSVVGMEASGHMYNNSWIPPHSQTQKMQCFSPSIGNEFRFIDDDTVHHENDNTGIPFLSWRLNVTDRPSLVHDFTR